jgi:DNA-binding transcriptional LysR family regulator
MPTVELVQLRYFIAIAESGSITGAARMLSVSQPTITVSIQRLEEELKTTLFLRGRAGMALTRTGEELLDHARDVFGTLGRAEQRIAGLEQDLVGNFVIGCHESLGAYFLPGFLKEFLRSAPSIEVSLWNGTSATVIDAVIERKVDFGLVVNPRPHAALVVIELFDDAMDLFVEASIVPKDDARDAQPTFERAVEMIKRGPLIYASRISQCQDLIDRLGVLHMLPVRRLSCGDLELVKSLGLAGVGVCMLPRRVAAYGHEGKLVRLHPGLPFFPDIISLVYRADGHRTRGGAFLKDALVAHGRQLRSSNNYT